MEFANQLEALKSMSLVVADTGDVSAVKLYKPTDCTTNPSLVLKAVQMKEYEHYLREAIDQEKGSDNPVDPARPYSGIADRLAVNMGAELLKIVPGRVSTEVDARLSFDTEATVAKARKLIGMYEAKGIDRSRVYIKIASTWEGIQACRTLQAEGIDCNMTLLFSFAQAVACANADATLISPFVGRILDWYKKAEGRDSYPADEDPGILSVRRIYRYYKRYGVRTVVMAASFRNADEIRELAGCDNITIAPALLAELEAATEPLPRKLTAAAGDDCGDDEVPDMDEDTFRAMMALDQMASEKLQEGIDGFARDQDRLEAMLMDVTQQNASLPL